MLNKTRGAVRDQGCDGAANQTAVTADSRIDAGRSSPMEALILHDLERVHHDIRHCVSRIDIMRIGHAMARPKVGAIFSRERRGLLKSNAQIVFANSDLSGFSIFEEAQYRGVIAADRVLRRLTGTRLIPHMQ